MLAVITICILCISIDTKLIQELSTPHLNTIWIPIAAWLMAVIIFALIAKHTKHLVHVVQIAYLALFYPVTIAKLSTLTPSFSLQTLLVLTLAILLAFIESFPPSFIHQRSTQLNSFNTSSFKIYSSIIFRSFKSYLLLILFTIFYLVTTFHPLFNGSDSLLDSALVFIVSIPLIYATRRLE